MNGWYFLATEVDDICFDYATNNVEQNNLSELIKGKSRQHVFVIGGVVSFSCALYTSGFLPVTSVRQCRHLSNVCSAANLPSIKAPTV